jgi:tetratricopeptide (TPR) repeat protein
MPAGSFQWIIRHFRDLGGVTGLEQRYTRNEVERMLGISRRQLDYWTRLRLVLPRGRWGERFYGFSDLVALETVKRLVTGHVPVRRIRRALAAMDTALGSNALPLSSLRVSSNGKQVVVHPPVIGGRPFEPLTGQLVLNFEISDLASKIHTMMSRSAEEWFEMGMAFDSRSESLEQAAEAYRRAVQAAPDWVEAHINLGTTLYLLNRVEEARAEFSVAAEYDPANALAEFNLGCVLEQIGQTDDSISHLRRAIEIAPAFADAHLNLGLACEKRGAIEDSIRHLSLYLRYEPHGPWAEFARSRIARHRTPRRPTSPSGKLTPFRRRQ